MEGVAAGTVTGSSCDDTETCTSGAVRARYSSDDTMGRDVERHGEERDELEDDLHVEEVKVIRGMIKGR